MINNKICLVCGVEKSLEDFYKQKTGKLGRNARCSECCRIKDREKRGIIRENLPNGKKRCSKCKIIKDIKDFHKDSLRKDGWTSQCKNCRQSSSNRWKSKNIDRVEKTNKKWRKNNKEHLRKYGKEWRAQNPKYGKKWYKNNKIKHAKLTKRWRDENKKYLRDKEREKLKNNIEFRLATRLRHRLRSALKNNYKNGSAVRDLGCSIKELKIYLESKFQAGMTWDNYGKWHIDHIIPLCSFNLEDRKQLIKACNYTNLQPLWAKDNLSKGTGQQ